MKPRQEIAFEGRKWQYDKEVRLIVYKCGEDKIYVDQDNRVAYRGIKRREVRKP